jgi:hypothetical protein
MSTTRRAALGMVAALLDVAGGVLVVSAVKTFQHSH